MAKSKRQIVFSEPIKIVWVSSTFIYVIPPEEVDISACKLYLKVSCLKITLLFTIDCKEVHCQKTAYLFHSHLRDTG